MGFNFYSKIIYRFLGISLFLPFALFGVNATNRQLKAEKNLIAASEKDLFLYRQMGASYLCIASKAEVDFNKGLGLSLIHISEPTRQEAISYAVFCLKKKK